MEEHPLKKLLDQIHAYRELGEGTPFAPEAVPIARSRPTSAGSNAASLSAARVTRPKRCPKLTEGSTLPRPWSASPRVSPQPLGPVAPSGPSLSPWFVQCVPHFEKMLYDNAQPARLNLHALQLTGDEFYRTIVEETLDHVACEMRGCEGGFCSTQ
jgi:hypothetical protein